jgi:hypothetical protein
LEPSVVKGTVMVAVPVLDATDATPRLVLPSVNVTVPVGGVEDDTVLVIVVVNVAEPFTISVVGVMASSVVVLAVDTVTTEIELVDVTYVAVPAYTAVRLCAPPRSVTPLSEAVPLTSVCAVPSSVVPS